MCWLHGDNQLGYFANNYRWDRTRSVQFSGIFLLRSGEGAVGDCEIRACGGTILQGFARRFGGFHRHSFVGSLLHKPLTFPITKPQGISPGRRVTEMSTGLASPSRHSLSGSLGAIARYQRPQQPQETTSLSQQKNVRPNCFSVQRRIRGCQSSAAARGIGGLGGSPPAAMLVGPSTR